MNLMATLRRWALQLKQHTLTIYFVARDRRTPWLVRLLALLVAAYALSPVDLIPDFIPVLGYLDDLVLVPLGLALVVQIAPPRVLASARKQAHELAQRPVSRVAGFAIVAAWLAILLVATYWAWDGFYV